MSATQLIVITGVTRGCGRAMSEAFAALGHTVVGCGRSEEELDSLRGSLPLPHEFARLDVSNDEQVAHWASSVLASQGPPGVLINNAAVINANAPLWLVPASEFDRVVDVNIKGVANVIRHFVPAMVRRQRGVIVNFSSGWGRSTDAGVAPYCATKWAIEGLTQALAQELPSGMAAVPLNPGIINTDMLRSCFGASASAYPSPTQWAKAAVAFILGLGPRHSGQPQTVPSIST